MTYEVALLLENTQLAGTQDDKLTFTLEVANPIECGHEDCVWKFP